MAALVVVVILALPRPAAREVVITRTVQVTAVPSAVPTQKPAPVAVVAMNYSAVYTKPVPDVDRQQENHKKPVVMLTYWELMTVLAETGWRPYITSVMYYDPESREWIHDITMQRKLYELAFCESTLNPRAVGDGGDSLGLFQINTKAWPELTAGVDLFNPEWNAEIAFQIWKHSEQSFMYWSCNPDSTG